MHDEDLLKVECTVSMVFTQRKMQKCKSSGKHVRVMYTPLNPTFI